MTDLTDTQPPTTAGMEREKENTRPTSTTQAAVTSVVDGVIHNASVHASLNKEKAHVQTLINGLVSRAHAQATAPDAPATPSATAPSKTVTGVPVNDYRPRRLAGLPIDWTQTRNSVTMSIRVPACVRKHDIRVHFSAGHIDLRVGCKDAVDDTCFLSIRRELSSPVDCDGCMWALEDDAQASTLIIELEKSPAAWWPTLFESDSPDEYAIVDGSFAEPAIHPSAAFPDGHAEPRSPICPVAADRALADEAPADETGSKDEDGSKDEPATPSLERAVETVVADVVASAVEGTVASAERSRDGTTVVEDGSDDEIEARPAKASVTSRNVITKADLPKLIEQHKSSLEQGGAKSHEAAIQLAAFYHYGIGVTQDDAEAARLYKLGLEGGVMDASAAFQLGLIYNQGASGLDIDCVEAVRWWSLSARLGNAVAMFNLGVMTMNGSGCEMDPIGALRWFERARLLDPKLETPQLSKTQLDQRVGMADRLRKERERRAVPAHVLKQRKEDALETVRWLGYTCLGAVGIGVSVLGVRYWLRNRL